MSVYYLTAFENFNGTPFPNPTKTTAYFIKEHENIALQFKCYVTSKEPMRARTVWETIPAIQQCYLLLIILYTVNLRFESIY